MTPKALTLKIFLAIVLNDISDSVAQLLMKKGLLTTGIQSVHFQNIPEFLSRNAGSPLLWLGILIYAANFFIWMVILSKVDLSVALPVGSTSYVFIPMLAVLFLKESVTPVRWLGILLIVLGVYCVSRSKSILPASPCPV